MAEISKREQKKLLAKQTIMETAIEQFVQRGFQATSIADIMKKQQKETSFPSTTKSLQNIP